MFTMNMSNQIFYPFIQSLRNKRRSNSQVFCKIGVLKCFRHSQGNLFAEIAFLINIVEGLKVSLSLLKKGSAACVFMNFKNFQELLTFDKL